MKEVVISTDIMRSPEQIIDDLFNYKRLKEIFSGESDDFIMELDGFLLTTKDDREDLENDYYKNSLDSEGNNYSLIFTRFRNVKCAVENLNNCVRYFERSKKQISDQNLFVKRVIMNMQRSYNMHTMHGIDVGFDFDEYIETLDKVAKIGSFYIISGNICRNELNEEAYIYFEEIKNAEKSKKEKVLQSICGRFSDKSLAQEWLENYYKQEAKEKDKNKVKR